MGLIGCCKILFITNSLFIFFHQANTPLKKTKTSGTVLDIYLDKKDLTHWSMVNRANHSI